MLTLKDARVGIPLSMLAIVLAGCGQTPERAVTVGTASPAEAAPSASAVEQPAGAGDQLDAAQVKKALLAVADLPTGWSAGENADDSEDDTSTVEPAACQTVFDEFDSAKGAKAAAEGMTTFNEGGDFGAELVQEISSYEKDGQDGKVQEVADALTKCSKMTIVDGSDRIPVTIAGLSFPNLGDQTLAMRMTAESGGIEVTIDAVFVAVGHNMVSYTASGLKPIPGAELEKVARAGMEKIAVVAKG